MEEQVANFPMGEDYVHALEKEGMLKENACWNKNEVLIIDNIGRENNKQEELEIFLEKRQINYTTTASIQNALDIFAIFNLLWAILRLALIFLLTTPYFVMENVKSLRANYYHGFHNLCQILLM